jgi:nucleotide-binding universal stress UspA family protein
MYDTVLFPTDGSEGADAALEHAIDVARRYDATLHVLYVADTNRDSVTVLGTEVVDTLVTKGEEMVAETAGRAEAAGLEVVTAVLQGDPVETILDYVGDREVDLVVMATRGRRGLDRFLLGSVTERVLRSVDVPVLTVRMGEQEREGE